MSNIKNIEMPSSDEELESRLKKFGSIMASRLIELEDVDLGI